MTSDPHRWLRARLDAHALGLLGESDETRFAAHVAECESCADLVETHRANLPAASIAPAHLPSTLLASWPRASATLRGLERRLVREHLETCDECRRDLAMLGHDPVLAPPAALERAAGAHAPSERRLSRLPTRRPSREWWLGGAVGAALATAASLVLTLGVLRPEGPGAPSPTPTPPGTPAPPAPAARLDLVPREIVLRSATRGGEAPPAISVTLPESTSTVLLRLPEWSGSAASPVLVRVRWPDHRPDLVRRFRFGQVLSLPGLALRSDSGPLPSGTYDVETTFGPDPAEAGSVAISLVSRLRLTVAANPGEVR